METIKSARAESVETVAGFLALDPEILALRVGERLGVRASQRRDAAVDIVKDLALMPVFARQDIMADLDGRYAKRTLERARAALEAAQLIEPVSGETTQGAEQAYRVVLEGLVDQQAS